MKFFIYVFYCCVGGSFLLPHELIAIEHDKQAEIIEIDREIAKLEAARLKMLGQADQREDEAIRWQFEPGQFNETKRAYAQANALRYEAKKIEEQIARLQRERERLLK